MMVPTWTKRNGERRMGTSGCMAMAITIYDAIAVPQKANSAVESQEARRAPGCPWRRLLTNTAIMLSASNR